MSDSLLSICIATYNRAAYIGETLESIIPQLDNEVELVVVDGASTDDTADVVSRYVAKEPRLRYVRLPVKGGIDRDYDKAVEICSGEFCWLFTDDDLIKPGAVGALKAAVKKGFDLVVVNAEIRDRELSGILERRRMNIEEDSTYKPDSLENLFIDALDYLTFIGAVVIRRSIWLARERSPYYGTEFVHVGVIFQKPLPGPALVIAEPYIVIRFGNAQWTPRSFEIWMFKWPRLVWSFKDISDRAKRRITKREPWKDFMALIVQRSTGDYNLQIYQKYLSNLKTPNTWKLFASLIARFPRSVIVGAHYLYSRRNQESKAFFDNHFQAKMV